jgi:glycosyltransferase involved in cell wall biosynthesis
MKILMVVHQFLPGHQAGAELYTYYLSRELSKNHQVHLFYAETDDKGREYTIRKGTFEGIPFSEVINHNHEFVRSYRNPQIDKIFEGLLRDFQPDIIHFQHLINLSVNLISIAKEKGIPTVMTLHEYWLMCPRWGQRLKEDLTLCDEIIPSVCAKCVENIYSHHQKDRILHILNSLKRIKGFRKIMRILTPPIQAWMGPRTYIRGIEERNRYIKNILSDVNLFISPSPFLRREFIRFGMPEGKIIFSDNGMDLSHYRRIIRKGSKRLRFSFIGSPVIHKGVHVLVEAFNGIKDPDVELNIYGDLSTHPEYSERLKQMAKNQSIHFKGRFENQRIGEILSNTDVLVVPSIWYENSPLTIHEAFIARIPVIASNLGGMADLVQDGVNGLLFEAGDAGDLRRKITALVNDHGILEKLRKGIPRIKTIEEDAKDMEGRYQGLLERRRAK